MSNHNPNEIDSLLNNAERIGVIGSPSSTSELSLDILGSAVHKKLIGELALFRLNQDNNPHYALGQITEVTLKNVWHEDPTMRSLIRQRGRIDAVSERQDTHQGAMTISAVFAQVANRYDASMLGTVPATGTSIQLVDDRILETLLRPYKDQLFFLGHVYGSTPKLPLWFKHFGSGMEGAGEAYHLGIFGKTGSGKSVLAKAVLLAYARHKDMGLFILDPMGEFSQGLRKKSEPRQMGDILSVPLLKGLNREFELYELSRIQLDRWELFIEMLTEFGFFRDLGIRHPSNQSDAAELVEDHLRNSQQFKLSELDNNSFKNILDFIRQNAQRIYTTPAGQQRVVAIIDEIRSSNGMSLPKQKWDKTTQLFARQAGSQSPQQIVQSALRANTTKGSPMVIIDLSRRPDDIGQTDWDAKIKPLLVDRFLEALIREAEKAYEKQSSLNTLVVLDEAHRFAPQYQRSDNQRSDNQRAARIRARLIDAVRTTRKFGLGWVFLSQTLSSLSTEIVQQLRIFFFGFGLSMGTEYQRLRELAGGQTDSLNLYQRFRDPQSAFDAKTREYSFMTIGPVSPLSFSGTPLFFNAFNNIDEFTKANSLSLQHQKTFDF